MLHAIFRADDISISRSTVLAARLAIERGVCRNVSVQAVGPHLAMVRELLVPLQRAGRIDIGLHVTLNCEWDAPRFRPVGSHPHPDLLDADGAFAQHPGILHERRLPGEAVVEEAAAQLARLRAHGIAPDYLDEHMAFGWVPSLKGALSPLCRREGLLEAERLRWSPVPQLPQQADPTTTALARIAALGSGRALFIGHPLLPDNENAGFRLRGNPGYDVNADRDAQRRMFTDPRIAGLVASGAVVSLRYREMAALG